MPEVIFVGADMARHVVRLQSGRSLMEAARDNGVPGIEAECGGVCACATCHVMIPDIWLAVTGTASEGEQDLLEFIEDRGEGSRLSCQIELSDDMDGLEVLLPASQGF